MQCLLGSSVSWVWPMGGTFRRPGSLEKERVGSFLPRLAVLGLHLQQFQPQVLLISPSFESPGSLGSLCIISVVLGVLRAPTAFSPEMLHEFHRSVDLPTPPGGGPAHTLGGGHAHTPGRKTRPPSGTLREGVPATPWKGPTEPPGASSLSFQAADRPGNQEPRAGGRRREAPPVSPRAVGAGPPHTFCEGRRSAETRPPLAERHSAQL